jgi:Na+-transporting methylmalonyl-CoA/oxaloacetate decarboxylase gamma subunit
VFVGGIFLLALFIGLIAIMIGIADIKDKIEAKKEEEEEARAAAEAEKAEKSGDAPSGDNT